MPDLATTWFILVGVLLVGYAILDGFDLGVGMLHLVVARDDEERSVLMRAIGPVWDGRERSAARMADARYDAPRAVPFQGAGRPEGKGSGSPSPAPGAVAPGALPGAPS